MSTSVAFRCECCKETFIPRDGVPQIDNDLGGPVCPDCKTKLQWAHARLKMEGITPCTVRHEGRAA